MEWSRAAQGGGGVGSGGVLSGDNSQVPMTLPYGPQPTVQTALSRAHSTVGKKMIDGRVGKIHLPTVGKKMRRRITLIFPQWPQHQGKLPGISGSHMKDEIWGLGHAVHRACGMGHAWEVQQLGAGVDAG